MKNATENKIKAIKAGKFGVEIEMYAISREKAARLVAEYFGTQRTVRRGVGYSRWVCEDTKGRTWNFMSDSSIHDMGNGGCEMVTPVLGYDEIETLQEVVRILRKNGAKSDPNHECGVHIHVDTEGQTAQSLRNLVNMMASREKLLLNAIGVGEIRRRWCKVCDPRFVEAMNSKKPTTLEQVQTIWYEAQGVGTHEVNVHYSGTRYHVLNLHSMWQGKGIEFRCFQFDNPTADRKGGLHAGQLKAYIQICLAMTERAKTGACRKAEVQQENAKYAMARWMSKLGMRGAEFDTAREIFERNLSGNANKRNEVAA